ncbi:hypothetical protein FOZ63_002514, partial [Perkinsus olseni]
AYETRHKRLPATTRRQLEGRCLVEGRRILFKDNLKFDHTDLSKVVSLEVLATVGGVYSERKGKYVVDYVTWRETKAMRNRPFKRSPWETTSTTKIIWITEPTGLPFTYDLPEVDENLRCGDTIHEWGRGLLERKGRSVNDNAAVLALAKEALKDSRFREEHDNSTKAYLYVFGPPESPLITTISFVRDALGKWFVNSIGLVDDVPSRERLVLPLYEGNLDRMRAWMLPHEDESDERDANRTASILGNAAKWGINPMEENIINSEYKLRFAAVTIAVATGWHKRLAPFKTEKGL